MNIDQMLNVLAQIPNRNITINPGSEQDNIIRHPGGPGWVLAGPGSGKTETLTILLLRLLYVENDPVQQNRTSPETIFITTFTKKAARNLEDRLSLYRNTIISTYPDLANIDVSKLRIGTLHGLCNDLMQEYRFSGYQNVRLMDELEQGMFIYEHCDLATSSNTGADLPFWQAFSYLIPEYIWRPTYTNLPNRWIRTFSLMKLFNRIVEDRISISQMQSAGGNWARLSQAYQDYLLLMQNNYRCDFSHLQLRFLEFLNSPLGQIFVQGDQAAEYPGIQWILVDEYQDTNLIQEEIYMTLANREDSNIVVVGDDDQALYRFRGGSVECMVSFDQACNVFLGIPTTSVRTFPLTTNYRSHRDIVTFCNNYITSFPIMQTQGARVQNKPDLIPGSNISGTYPAVGTLEGRNVGDSAQRFAQMVQDLFSNNIIYDVSQCCLLLTSTKETAMNALPYVNALRAIGLTPYNPRNKAYLEQEEIQTLFGALVALLDPFRVNVPQNASDIVQFVNRCSNTFSNQERANPELAGYMNTARTNLSSATPGTYLPSGLMDVVYYLLNLPPFEVWMNNPLNRARLAKLTNIIDAYIATPVPGYPNASRATLRTSLSNQGEVDAGWLRRFYYIFYGYLAQKGMDDYEDDEIICPPGMVPVMTIHQAKGLQFPFVFVGHMSSSAKISDSHILEDELGRFPLNGARSFTRPTRNIRAQVDLVRQFFVAYSRAERALIFLGTRAQLRSGSIPAGPFPGWILRNTIPL